jgi:hypothetical protein
MEGNRKMRPMTRCLLRTALVIGTCVTALPGTASAACDAPGHREFDFWLGEWQVHTPDGTLAGINRIERGYGGCVLHERYKSSCAYSGESLNIYDASRKVWHQTWVDNTGTLLVLEGGLRDGGMVLESVAQASGAQHARHRITWTANPDGSVRQLWESTDAQGRWSTAFDGMYTRR